MQNEWQLGDYFNKTILYFLFKMLRNFILAAQQAAQSKIFDVVQLVKKTSE